MIGLIRGLLDRPLDPRHARAILVLASSLTVAFAGLVAGGVIGGSRAPGPDSLGSRTANPGRPSAPPAAPIITPATRPQTEAPQAKPPRQDPQDRRGSGAYRRARRSLRRHLALQLLPYRHHRFSITMVGADGSRAILRVDAPTVAEARRGWRRFLHRLGDSGSSYLPRFHAEGARHAR